MAENAQARLKVVFMGTPAFAAQSLRHLVAWDGCEVVGVYTQPDRPAGRGQQQRPSAVKVLALEHNLPVFQPTNFRQQADVDALYALQADVLVVAAYGLILPQSVLDAAPMGAINVHGSLLPRYRGAAPIQRAVMNGDAVTGITIMQVVEALDAGPMLMQRALGIGVDDTSAILHDELAELGGSLLVTTLARMVAGTITPMPQDEALVTYAAKLTKTDGLINWNRPATEVHAHIRGVTPWPSAYCTLEMVGRKPMRVTMNPGRIGEELSVAYPEGIEPGTLVGLVGGALAFACSDRLYLVPTLRPADKKPMDANAFWCGYAGHVTEGFAGRTVAE